MDREEIILVGEYKNFKADKHFYVDNLSEQELSGLLVQLSEHIEPFIYQFSGIDTKKIDVLVPVLSDLSAVGTFLKSFKRDTLLSAAQNKSTMFPIAESYLLNQLFKKAKISFKPTYTTSISSEIEKPEDTIAFIGNCKGWFSAKKMSVNASTQDWEVSGILSGINHTLVNKAFEFVKMNEVVGSKARKSFGNLATALLNIDSTNPYLICRTCENFGYKPYATPEILMDEYPDIKKPKVKGRKPKG